MPKQFERDTSDSVARAKEALGVDGQFGGGAIEYFRKGWAMDIWGATGRVHYWTRTNIMTVVSRCGIVKIAEWTGPDGRRHPRLHGGGDFPRCKRCESITRRR